MSFRFFRRIRAALIDRLLNLFNSYGKILRLDFVLFNNQGYVYLLFKEVPSLGRLFS